MAYPSALGPYRTSLAGTLLAAREAVMAPIRPALRDAGVTEQQWRVLRVLSDEGALEPSRLAEAALLHPPSVTRIVREMLERQLLQRAADPQDGRRSILSLTPQGQLLVEDTARRTHRILADYGDRFGSDRLARLLSEMTALVEAIGPMAEGSADLREN